METKGRYSRISHSWFHPPGPWSVRAMSKILLVFLLLQLADVQYPIMATARANSSACPSVDHPASQYAIDTAHQLAAGDGSGSFPDIGDVKGSSYRINVKKPGTLDREISVELDGVPVVTFSSFATQAPINLPSANSTTVSAIIGVLAQISGCANAEEINSILRFFSEFGWGWMIETSGKFFTEDSPMSAMTSDGSFSRTVGSLPLQVYGMKELSDGRVVVLIGDGSIRNSLPRRLINPAEGSVWVFQPVAGQWKVDAIFGGISALGDTWTTVPIGVGVELKHPGSTK